MMKVKGHEIDFDITSPDDLQRYLAASDAMEKAAATLPPMPSPAEMASPAGIRAYTAYITVTVDNGENNTAYITGQCKLVTDFIDAAFGDGTCNALLGPKTSLDALMDVTDALRDAIAAQGQRAGERITGYMPNRATRRAAQKKADK